MALENQCTGITDHYPAPTRNCDAISSSGAEIAAMVRHMQIAPMLLDDGGLEKLDLGQRNDMLEPTEDRHGSKSTMISSQLPVKDWHSSIGDATLADAILDRLVHNSHRVALKGQIDAING